MREHRKLVAEALEPDHIEIGEDDTSALLATREHVAPRADDHRVAVGLTAARVLAPLTGRDDERQRLDGAGLQQRPPMHASGRYGERRRHDDDLYAEHAEPVKQRR